MKIIGVSICVAACLVISTDASSTAVLAEPVKFPVTMHGRQIGESTVQPGATVEVLGQAGGRVRIKYGAAEPQWVEVGAVRDLRVAAPAETTPTEAEPPAGAEGEAAAEPVEEPLPEPSAAEADKAGGAEPEVAADGSSANFEITVKGAKVPVERWGTGETGIIFFSNSGDLAADLRQAKEEYENLSANGCSLFLWSYPQAVPFSGVQQAIGAFVRGGEERVDFTGAAKEVLEGIKKETGLQKFLLVGNSLGGGVILWDHAELAKDENLKFMLISPTEVFMPDIDKVGPMDRTALIAHRRGDDFVKDRKIASWIASHRSALTAEADSRAGHIIVGRDLGHPQLAAMIASFLELPSRR